RQRYGSRDVGEAPLARDNHCVESGAGVVGEHEDRPTNELIGGDSEGEAVLERPALEIVALERGAPHFPGVLASRLHAGLDAVLEFECCGVLLLGHETSPPGTVCFDRLTIPGGSGSSEASVISPRRAAHAPRCRVRCGDTWDRDRGTRRPAPSAR